MTIFDVDSSCDSDGNQLLVHTVHNTCFQDKLIQYTREEMLRIQIIQNHVDPLPNFVMNIRERFGALAAILIPGEEFEEIMSVEEDWNQDILEALTNNTNCSLDEQYEHLALMVAASPEKLNLMESVIEDIQAVLRQEFPGCHVVSYGSSTNGFALQDCDLDVYVNLPNIKVTNPQRKTQIVSDCLRRVERYRSATPIIKARTPIVKLFDRKSRIKIDINVTCEMGVKNSQFLNYCRKLDKRCEQLVRIIKYYCYCHDITGSGPGNHFTSYSIVLMVIFYLQVKGILPSVEVLQDGIPKDNCDGWNFAFNEKHYHENQFNESIRDLVRGFFQYYKGFSFETQVVCPLVGYSISKYRMKHGFDLTSAALEHSPHFGRRKQKLELNKTVVIQDPFELTRNTAAAVDKTVEEEFKLKMKHGLKIIAAEAPLPELFKPMSNDEKAFTDIVEMDDELNGVNEADLNLLNDTLNISIDSEPYFNENIVDFC